MYSTSHLTRRDLEKIKRKVKNLSTLADLSVAIQTTSIWIAARTQKISQRETRKGERNDKDLRIAQSVRHASTRYSTAEPATYFPSNR